MKNFRLFNLISRCFFLLPSLSSVAEAPSIQWQNTIGGSGSEELYSVQQTTDGGFILGGYSVSNISGDKTENCYGGADYWIVKTDSSGNIQWQNTIGGNSGDELYSIQQTIDGGYILGGTSYSDSSGDKAENSNGYYDYWLVKTDSLGNVEWQNTIGGNGDDYLQSIKQTADGGYILCGYSWSNISGDKTENNLGDSIYYTTNDYWIVKTDSQGIIQWQNTIGGSDDDELYSIQQTADGGYILGGFSWSDSSGDKTENSIGWYDYWIVKTDTAGNVQWDKTIGGSDIDYLYSIQQTADGGYILGGLSDSNISGDKTENSNGLGDYWILKINSSGTIQWQKTIGGSDHDWLNSVQQTNDGGYILGGSSRSDISGDKTENSYGYEDYWIVKTDSTGKVGWQKTLGGNELDDLYSVQQTADGGYILGGYSWSNISGDKTENSNGERDYWVIKLYPDNATGIADSKGGNSSLKLYPNPVQDELTIEINYPFSKDLAELDILDFTGRIIYHSIMPHSLRLTTSIDISSLPTGIYLAEIKEEGTHTEANL